ncbi:unnamed protein product [Sphagnum tenellum]
MLVAAPTFTPSSYTPLQAMTSTPIYTMEVSSSSGRIEKFSGRPGTISLREFKATFSTMVCELELKYGANYTEAFAFKQLARYVHYEALDMYEQHFARILGVTQAPNLAYAIAIATASQATLQAAIAHHGTVPNNPDPVLQWVSAEFGNSYTLLDVYNISEKLELAHAHYWASTVRPPSRSRPQPTPAAPTRSSHSSSRTKVVHSATPILPSSNYYGNPAHKATSSVVPQPKAKAPQPSTQALPTKGNSYKNAKKKEQNADKKEVL